MLSTKQMIKKSSQLGTLFLKKNQQLNSFRKTLLTTTSKRNFLKLGTTNLSRTTPVVGSETRITYFKVGNRKNYNWKNWGKNQSRGYRSTSSSESSSSNTSNIIGIIGIVGLIGGGYLLLNTLNMPAIRDTSSRGGNVYGDSISNTTGRSTVVYEKPSIPSYVSDYLAKVYYHVAAGLGITAGSAALAFKTGVAHRMLASNSMVASFGLLFGSIGTMILCRSIPTTNTVAKWGTFGLFNSIMGISLCSLAFVRPNILLRAGIYTMGIFGALSFTAIKAKEEKFLFLGGPLLAGLCVIVLSSFVGMFLPARFVKTLSLIEALSLYGGLVIFGGYLLYDTQKIMQRAKHRHIYEKQHPSARLAPPDYIGESISIYLDIINIFIRLVTILSNNKK